MNETLSSKDILVDNKTGIHWRKEEDVKEFIQKLKQNTFEDIDFSWGGMVVMIDKLAGEKLL